MHQRLAGPAPGAVAIARRARRPLTPDRRVQPTGPAGLPWSGPGRPATAAEEGDFVARLGELVGDDVDPSISRRDVTAVVNALRCGLRADDLLHVAPGLVPGRLLAAYHEVDARRLLAVRAWTGIVAEPTPAMLFVNGPAAAELLPIIVGRAVERDSQLTSVIADAAASVERVGHLALVAEAAMAAARAADAVQMGRALFDLHAPALWHHDHFLAPRVGALVPTRLAALLGEFRAAAA